VFKKYDFHVESNNLIELFKPLLNFEKFTEIDAGLEGINYSAEASDKWRIVINFPLHFEKHGWYVGKSPSITFKNYEEKYRYVTLTNDGDLDIKKDELTEEDRAIENKRVDEFIDYFHKLYNPNFDRMLSILQIFTKQGLDAGIFQKINLKKYEKHSRTHIQGVYNPAYASITFNNILQSLRAGETSYKKSVMSIDFIYLVSSDNKIVPYFKIRLPYTSHKKVNCIISFDCSKVYFTKTDHEFQLNYIDQLESHQTDDEFLNLFFKNVFNVEVVNSISKTLKMKKADLKKLSQDELKDYFVIVDMIKF
jgi:hypothetical protein